MSGDYGEMLQQSSPAGTVFAITTTPQGLISLRAGEATMYREQLDIANPDDATWLDAAMNAAVLVIGGDNLTLAGSGLNTDTAARLGTLVTGLVPVLASGVIPHHGTSAMPRRAGDRPGTN
ncbi:MULTISPECIES: hypothetical protein [unclassified Arthrobacter]|uniref:hypothetical protein n=1 Tax=unclassified Arthrobacter TaxID=235627 RepID=UPI001F1C564A|nr:hypothetical protein [Arthrobacter sp. FW305-BF8]UKA53926.1 hypothetical protein LFT45_19805 [Arthrobacter sp. FW305-BF8]